MSPATSPPPPPQERLVDDGGDRVDRNKKYSNNNSNSRASTRSVAVTSAGSGAAAAAPAGTASSASSSAGAGTAGHPSSNEQDDDGATTGSTHKQHGISSKVVSSSSGGTERSKKMQALEIDTMNEPLDEAELEADNLDTDRHRHHQSPNKTNEDLRGLLGSNSHDEDDVGGGSQTTSILHTRRVGNMRVFLPFIFHRTGWGILGPHWFGPLAVLGIIIVVSLFFIGRSLAEIGPLTAATCAMFAILTSYHLLNTALRDPGVVLLQQHSNATAGAGGAAACRWCDVCETFQPPDGAHCPDCNVCVAGFDHHCVWMGTCIGRNNFKQFIRFNLSWMAYLLYAIVWVTIVGPLVASRPQHHMSDTTEDHSTTTQSGGGLLLRR